MGLHPLLALGLGDVLEDGTVRVASHEVGAQATDELEGLFRERPPREVAAEDDQVGLGLFDFGEDGLESGCVPVDVRRERRRASTPDEDEVERRAPARAPG